MIKTTIRLEKDLLSKVDKFCDDRGIVKNNFYRQAILEKLAGESTLDVLESNKDETKATLRKIQREMADLKNQMAKERVETLRLMDEKQEQHQERQMEFMKKAIAAFGRQLMSVMGGGQPSPKEEEKSDRKLPHHY